MRGAHGLGVGSEGGMKEDLWGCALRDWLDVVDFLW